MLYLKLLTIKFFTSKATYCKPILKRNAKLGTSRTLFIIIIKLIIRGVTRINSKALSDSGVYSAVTSFFFKLVITEFFNLLVFIITISYSNRTYFRLHHCTCLTFEIIFKLHLFLVVVKC